MDQEATPERRGPISVLDVLVTRGDQPRPRLLDRQRFHDSLPPASMLSCAAPTVAGILTCALWSSTIRAATSALRAVASIRSGCPGSHGAPTVISQPPAYG